MLKTLRITFSLRMTSKVNAILYGFKHLPLLRKWLPDDIYRIRWLKAVAVVLSVLWEIFGALFGKAFFLLAMVLLPAYLLPGAPAAQFAHIFLILTVVGGVLNEYLLDHDDNAYHLVLLLGMDARQYTLVNFTYSQLKLGAVYLLFFLLLGRLNEIPVWQWVGLPLFAVSVKTFAGWLELRSFRRTGQLRQHKSGYAVTAIAVGLACAYGLPFLGILIPGWACAAAVIVTAVLAAVCLKAVAAFPDYRAAHQQLHVISLEAVAELQEANTKQSLKEISDDGSITSHRRGFAYLNDLFFQRHRKLLWKPCITTTALSVAVVAVAVAGMWLLPELRPTVNGAIMTLLPSIPFLMYVWNRGEHFTKTLFVNCDRSLLTYAFFKDPKSILKLFAIRLWSVVRMNLLPAAVIAAGLPLLLWCSGGTERWTDYLVLSVTVVAMSVFFSVHYLTIYYLLQPYTAETEVKSPLYPIITGGTYVLCYMLLQAQLPAVGFGLLATAFCLVYCLIAFVLVYLLAPKTFKLRS